MSTTPARLPDWFDVLWEEKKSALPFYLQSDSAKTLARQMVSVVLDGMAKQAGTPEGVRVIIAFAKIVRIMKGSQGVLDSPDPSPEQVADAVEKLMQRVKP